MVQFFSMLSPLLCTAQLLLSTFSGIPGRLDIAGGPSFHHFDAPLSELDGWIPGFNLDLGVAVSGEVARSKAPKRYKSAIPKDGEIVVRPLWLAIIPRQVVLSPGGKLNTLGFVWETFGLSSGLKLTDAASLKVGIELPEISWLSTWGPATPKASSLWAVGISPDAHLQVDPISWMRMDLGWAHHLDIPFGSLALANGRLAPWSWGSAYFQLHLRPGISI